MDGREIMINSDLIEIMSHIPNTTILILTNGSKYTVKEDMEEINDRIIKFKASIYKYTL